MFVTNMWEEDDASIDEPAKVEAERGKEDHVVQEPQATAADFYITFLSVAQREENNKLDATAGAAEDDDGDRNEGAEDNHPGFHVLVAVVQKADQKAEGSKKKCHKHLLRASANPTFIPAAENGDLHQNILKVVLGRYHCRLPIHK